MTSTVPASLDAQSRTPVTSADLAEPPPDPVVGDAGDGVPLGRIHVLDTSALAADPAALDAYPGCALVVPLTVVEELDGLKRRPDDVGRNARSTLRRIEELRVAAGGDIRQPVSLPRTATLRVEPNGVQVDRLAEHGLDPRTPDNRILAAALGQTRHGAVTFVSNDAALRIKAAQLGLEAIEHHPDRRPGRLDAMGWTTLDVSPAVIDDLHARRAVELDGACEADALALRSLALNEFAVLAAGSQSALARRRGDQMHRIDSSATAWDLAARSKEQRFALDLLLDPEVRVVALEGPAGTGKTILAIAAGLEQVAEPRSARYQTIRVFRPIVPVGRDLGYLPGDVDDKLEPWMAAITDALVALGSERSEEQARSLVDELRDRRQLSLESTTFLRGRTLADSWVVVDEAQNLEPSVLKTILTRLGEGSKVVFTGDITQIDQPYLSETNNALSVLVDRFRGEALFGAVRLSTCERSEVAHLAAVLL
jgi:PhoH-like ATPase